MASREDLKAVLFDLDGTLVSLRVDWPGLKKALQWHFATHGLELPEGPLLDSLRYLDKFTPRSVMDEAFKLMEQFELEGLRGASVCKGAVEVLSWLRTKEIPYGIVSNNSPVCIEKAVIHFGIPQPNVIVGRDRVLAKPSQVLIQRALSNIHVSAGPHVWLIGDRDVDLEAGKRLHLTVALTRPSINASYKVIHINHLTDLIDIWRSLLELQEGEHGKGSR